MTINPARPIVDMLDVTILSGSAITAEINLANRTLVGIYTPSAWTAANLTIEAGSVAGGTFVSAYSVSGSELTLTADANRFLPVEASNLLGAPFIKIRSGTASTPVNQAADRTLTLALASFAST